MTWTDDFTPEQTERLLAWIALPRPWWLDRLIWVLLTVPGCAALGERLHDYDVRRAVRIYRARGRA